MTKGELLSKVTSAELTEWMGLQTLRHREEQEARNAAGPQTRNMRQPRVRKR